MKSSNWVIAGKPEGSTPEIGKTYEIRDSRKGTFKGEILKVSGEFASVNIIEGKVGWVSKENRLFNSNPKTVSIRDCLVYLIEV